MFNQPKHCIFFLSLFAFVITLPLFIFAKGEIVFLCNYTYSNLSVLLFRAINMLGDGILFLYVGLFFLLTSYRRFLFLGCLVLLQTVIVRLFKDGFANGWPRPFMYFQELQFDLQVGQMVNIHMVDTFPSGHATTAFTLAIFLIFQMNKLKQQLVVLIIFSFAAFARVYLAQHFYIDVVAGFFVSVISFIVAHRLFVWFSFYSVKGSLLKSITIKRKWNLPSYLTVE